MDTNSDNFLNTEISVSNKSNYSIEAVLVCITKLLEIDPAKIGKTESVRLIINSISCLMNCEEVQVLEVIDSNSDSTKFLKYHIENKKPEEIITKKGINRYCVDSKRFFLAKTLNHDKKIASGLSGEVSGKPDIREEQISYIMMPPDKDEESALFYPLISGKECIGTIKLCNFTKPNSFTLDDLYFFRPVADVISNLLHLYAVIDDLDKKNQEYETLAAETDKVLTKLQVGEKLTYQFLTATSHLHDLAGLLAGMASDREEFLSVIDSSTISQKEKSEIIEVIERYSKHRKDAHKKVRELLRDRPKREQLFIKPNNIKDLINEQLEIYQAQFKNAEMRIKKSLNVADRLVPVDASAFKYVLRILLNNAIRAVCDGQNRPRTIEIHPSLERQNLVIRISDNGVGVKPGTQKRIFEAFYTTKNDGSGIGLFWAKKSIEEDHGGELILERSYPKSGSVFKISLPLQN